MGEKTLWLPEQASTIAGEIDSLFYFVLWVSTVMFVAVVAAKFYFAYKYRRRSATDRTELVHESKALETAWIVIPTILTLIVFTWGFQGFIKLNTAPPDSYEITVVGKQWAWDFIYDDGTKVSAEFAVPMGRPVKLNMNSVDVLHGFYIPAFRTKMDVIPNRYTSIWFEATKEGTFQVYCTEYCGTTHSGMLAKIHVMNQGDFENWLNENSVGDLTPVELGERLYNSQTCVACHSIDGSAGIGPTFQGLYNAQRPLDDGSNVLADESYLLESIVNPMAKIAQGYGAIMPASYGTTLSSDELNALVEYIKTFE